MFTRSVSTIVSKESNSVLIQSMNQKIEAKIYLILSSHFFFIFGLLFKKAEKSYTFRCHVNNKLLCKHETTYVNILMIFIDISVVIPAIVGSILALLVILVLVSFTSAHFLIIVLLIKLSYY